MSQYLEFPKRNSESVKVGEENGGMFKPTTYDQHSGNLSLTGLSSNFSVSVLAQYEFLEVFTRV